MSEENSDAMDTIISDETDEERTCLLGGGAGRSPIDRVIGFSIERKGLFYLLTLERIGFVATEAVDLTISDEFFSSCCVHWDCIKGWKFSHMKSIIIMQTYLRDSIKYVCLGFEIIVF